MNLPEPVAWADDAALAGGSGNCASAYAKAYWARGDFVDKMTAEKLKHPLFTAEQMAAAVAQEREWIPVSERLPMVSQFCDWLYPTDPIKHQRWVLCGEAMFTATVPGDATHWRPAKPLPAAIRATPTEPSK